MANKVTLKQIAREVGLSPASVSLVLNNRPCRISEENRRRIKVDPSFGLKHNGKQ